MKTVLITAALAAAVLVAPAAAGAAADERMNNREFVNAGKCLTFASLTVLQSDAPDVSALAQDYEAQSADRSYDVIQQTRVEARRIVVDASHASTDRQIERLRDRRDRVCSRFEQVQMNGG